MHEAKTLDLMKRLESAEGKNARSRKRMFQRKPPEEDSVLITISDFMTLLLIFFISLYRMEVSSSEPRTDVPIPLPDSSVTMPVPVIEPIVPKKQEPPALVEQSSDDRHALDTLKEELVNSLDQEMNSNFYVRMDDRQVIIVLGESITFESGQAEIVDQFQPVLSQLARLLSSRTGVALVVSGHTDDTPIHNEKFPSNWELSTARAVSVAKSLISAGVEPQRISVQGYAEYMPLYENDTEIHKQANRRVEIALVRFT